MSSCQSSRTGKARKNGRKNGAKQRSRLLQRNPHSFRKHEYPRDLQRGLFTLFIEDDQGQHISQVWASTPGSAASLMAPWAKLRLRRARRHEEVPVTLVGWDDFETLAELSEATGIPQNELDPGCMPGQDLQHVWIAEHEAEGKTSTLYVVETIGLDQGMMDEPWC